jgi:cyclophilin family peptidyl-prolyl cis-trans isomerase
MRDLFVLTPVRCRRFTDDSVLQADSDPKCPRFAIHFPVSFWLLLRPIMQFSTNSSSPKTRRQRFLQLLWGSLSGRDDRQPDPSRSRLQLEPLEKRQLLAGDMELLFTEPGAGLDLSSDTSQLSDSQLSDTQLSDTSYTSETGLQAVGMGEGEAADDLVQFAKDLAASGAQFFGAAWCAACTQQKQLFEDGGDFLPFLEVTNPDRTLNSVGVDNSIASFPTWTFADGSRQESVMTLAELSTRSGVVIPQSEDPSFVAIGDKTVGIGAPLHVGVDAYSPLGGPLTVTVSVSDPSLLEAQVLSGNRSIRIDMQGYGDMVLELFEQRAPDASGRVIELAEDNFYDGIIFHRVINNFMIQGGDPTGTGSSGSELGSFDDDFHPELLHVAPDIISFAKSSDDTNNSQFFITEVPTRYLDGNHSVFGQVVEGSDVREAISETSTGAGDRPDIDIEMTTVSVFDDTENSVVMLKPTGAGTGQVSVTYTVTDQAGNSVSETTQVTVNADSANTQPWLNDIATPGPTSANTNAELQLTSTDVEGDAVTYFAQSLSSPTSGSVSIDANSGLVTVTPETDFAGVINVRVGVGPGAGVVGNSNSDSDTQTVAFVFQSAGPEAPTSVDLAASDDSGASDSDSVTNDGSMSFQVEGVQSGATVELVDLGSSAVVGTAVASQTSVLITTSNIAALGDGTYQLVARQTSDGQTSNVSPSLTLIYDTTEPGIVSDTANTDANVGAAYSTDLISSEEGSGLVYSLVSGPTGATLSSTSGIVNWTPTSGQVGSQTFSIELTDLAGNVRSDSFTVNVAQAPLAAIRIDLTDLSGNPITGIAAGQEFLLKMVAEDNRGFIDMDGIYGAFADISFDESIVRPKPGTAIQFSPAFTVTRKGSVETGLINELGAVSGATAATNLPESLIATIQMEALSTGNVNIISSPADEVSSEFLLFGVDNTVPASAVSYGSTSLAVGQSFTLNDDAYSVLEDSGDTVLDVLSNDVVNTGGESLTLISASQPTDGGTVTVSDGVLTFSPAANYVGPVVFTYRVTDNAGVQQNATVTVDVTNVNDAPTGVDDAVSVDQNSTENVLNVLQNDQISPDTGETLTITSVSTPSNGGSAVIAEDGMSVSFTPAPDFAGVDTFTYIVSDGDLQDVATVTVTVAPADNPPTAVGDAYEVVEDAATADFIVLSNDVRDVDNEGFVLDSIGVPDGGGQAVISADGTQLTYTPAPDFNGVERVPYTIRDTGGGISVGTVTFTVTPVNDLPPISDLGMNLNRASAQSSVFDLDDLPANVDAGETLSITVVSDTSAGGTAIVDTETQAILYTPPSPEFVGTDTITYTISDGIETSTGTITVEVTDFETRKITIDMNNAVGEPQFAGIVLRGTNLLGEAVEIPLDTQDGNADFGDLMPGDYNIEIPANPFIQGADQPQMIPVTSLPEDGDVIIRPELGQLKSKYVSIRDFFGSASSKTILVALEPGLQSVLTIASPEVDVEVTNVELDPNTGAVTIQAVRTETDDQGTVTQENVEALGSTDDTSRVETRGVEGAYKLLKIRLGDNGLNFSPVSPPAGEPEGEALPAGNAEGEALATINSPLTVGEMQAEGESTAALAVTQADLFVPVASNQSTRTDAAVLATERGDLWLAETLATSDAEVPQESSQIVDQVMQNVADELTIIQSAGDDLVDHDTDLNSLHESNVDAALGSEI